MEYLKQPAFWLAVVAVALAVNWAWTKFGKQGKLV
jgi:hypothetical protein